MSREEAIEILSEMRAEYNLFGDEEEATRYHVLSWTIQAMKDTQRWNPVSERLPEEDTDVLISYRYKEGEGDTSHVYIDITSYGDMYFGGRKVKGAKHWRQPFEYFTSNYEVIAWMPLPEPWKGEEE